MSFPSKLNSHAIALHTFGPSLCRRKHQTTRDVRQVKHWALSFICLTTISLSGTVALAQTRQFLDAPVVKSRVSVRWNAADKTMEWVADDGDEYRAIKSDTLFLSKQSIRVAYPQLNPLSVQASASATAVEDPSYAAIKKLLDAITSVATTVAPVAPTPLPPGAAPPLPCSSAANDIHNLYVLLYGQSTTADQIKSKVALWRKAIDDTFAAGGSGPAAITAAINAIRKDAGDYQTGVNNAKSLWSTIKGCANAARTPASEVPLYTVVALNDQTPRIEQLTAIVTAANDLADLLSKQYQPGEKWVPKTGKTDYLISGEIEPTFANMQRVTVKVESIALNVNAATGAISTDRQLLGSATFDVRHYAVLVPEIGVGAVFGTIKRPTYGTGTNASGQTIVVKVKDNSVSVNPTILANFVCRCGTGLLVPMFQVGAAASKDVPAILTGGGLRLFGVGKGDVAVGGGAMFAWFKDLQTLQVGQTVSGTAAINSDLGFSSTPHIGGYFTIQYKF